MRWTLALILLSFQTSGATLHLEFKQILSEEGKVSFVVFSREEGFPDRPPEDATKGTISVKEAVKGVRLELPPGTYSVSAIHDENGNGELDTNFLGIPKESFGFSNNPRVLFGPPSFKEASFEVSGEKRITIEMVDY